MMRSRSVQLSEANPASGSARYLVVKAMSSSGRISGTVDSSNSSVSGWEERYRATMSEMSVGSRLACSFRRMGSASDLRRRGMRIGAVTSSRDPCVSAFDHQLFDAAEVLVARADSPRLDVQCSHQQTP